MQKKIYTSAPLPFMGQKRRFAGEFKKVLEQYPDDITIVDLFGGSGLLSHIAKRTKPHARVIYNDYDNYTERLANIPRTNVIIARIREITAAVPKHKAIPEPLKNKILALIKSEQEARGYVDYLTISSSLLFSSKYATCYEDLKRETFYSKARKSDYDASGYLDGIEVVHEDYRALYKRYRGMHNIIFLVDPPYLSTEVGSYRMSWKLSDYLDVLTVLSGHSFVYFTSDKSGIVELCEWMGKHPDLGNPFTETKRIDIGACLNYNSTYTDTMIYKTTA
jgi:hypothetical protein